MISTNPAIAQRRYVAMMRTPYDVFRLAFLLSASTIVHYYDMAEILSPQRANNLQTFPVWYRLHLVLEIQLKPVHEISLKTLNEVGLPRR